MLFIEQFYYPEGWGGAELPRDLTTFLSGRGYEVEVICGREQYVAVSDGEGVNPEASGVKIRRVPSLLPGRARRAKMVRQLWFCGALIPLLLCRRRPDALIVQTNPPLMVYLAALAARLWRRPLIIIAMDVYPEVIEAHGMIRPRGVIACTLRRAFRWSYRGASCVVALGPTMKDRLLRKGVAMRRIAVISNWATGAPGVVRGEKNALRSQWGLQSRFVLVYSGNLGLGHEFQTLLRGLEMARSSVPDLALVIVGEGRRLAEAQSLVRELKLHDLVQFSDFVPAARVPESLGLADVAVVTLQPGFEGLIVPSKVLSYMARGIPVLYIGPASDIDDLLHRAGCGVVVRNGDVAAVARAVLELHSDSERLMALGVRGQRFYDAELTRERALPRYEEVIRSCLAELR